MMLTIVGAVLLVILFCLHPVAVVLGGIGFAIGGGVGAFIGALIGFAIQGAYS